MIIATTDMHIDVLQCCGMKLALVVPVLGPNISNSLPGCGNSMCRIAKRACGEAVRQRWHWAVHGEQGVGQTSVSQEKGKCTASLTYLSALLCMLKEGFRIDWLRRLAPYTNASTLVRSSGGGTPQSL